MNKHLLILSIAASAVLADTFTLGQVNVLDTSIEDSPFEKIVTSEEIAQHNSENISDALDNVSGINQDTQGGRNEATLYIRGFDSKRIGVFIDGIPIYVPYDGNFDYGRFLTADIDQIDISKGYSSIAYGANTMGGVINIISKKPTKALEGEIKTGIVLDSDGSMSRHIESVNIGTKQDHIYAQLGALYSNQDHLRLSDDYSATSSQPEGDRLRSKAKDYKVSFKTGYIADDGSEIAVGYASQNGEKQQPPAIDTTFSKTKYWDWPYWDKETVFINGQKNLSNGYVKALVYYDTFKNSLYSYDDATYSTMTKGSSFKNKYDDYSVGAHLEYGIELGKHSLTASANYKKDSHKGYDISKTTNVATLTENYEDHTVSFGIEDVYNLSPKWQLLGGISYDIREGDKIYDTNTAYLDMLALETQSAFNPQVALIYTIDPASKLRASISSKTYMPSMKDRYSRKFNSYVPNPDLENELATHYELSYQKSMGAFSGKVNGFFTRVDDAIQSVVYPLNTAYYQNQNVGSFNHYGLETELSYKADNIEVGGNYTYIYVENRTENDVKRTDVPKHQFFTYVEVDVGSNVSLYGDIKFRKGAYEQKLDSTYVINPTFTIFDIKAIYKPTPAITTELGIKNLTDKLYRYDMAFPMAGREFFFNVGYKF